jgi:hypothetical protein
MRDDIIEQEWNEAASVVLENERTKRADPRWLPTYLNGAYAFGKKVENLVLRRKRNLKAGSH